MIEIEPRGVRGEMAFPPLPVGAFHTAPEHAQTAGGTVFLLHDQVCLPAAELPGKQNFKMDGPSVRDGPYRIAVPLLSGIKHGLHHSFLTWKCGSESSGKTQRGTESALRFKMLSILFL